jgi:hypothetical protein
MLREYHCYTSPQSEEKRVPLDKSEGVVKRQFFSAMLSSTAWISEWWRTEALKLSR